MNLFRNRLASLIFPQRCAFCGTVVPAGKDACEACAAALPFVPDGYFARRGCRTAVFPRRGRHLEFDGIAAPFFYEGPAKKGIWRIKFGRKQGGAAAFARYAARTVVREYGGISFDLIAFVPLSAKELRRRGFNQSEVLARALSAEIGVAAADLLKKPSDIRPQRSCAAFQRWGNVFGAFAVNGGQRVKGRTVLLVDDVSTTGATLSECAKTLKLAGAERVFCIVMAAVEKYEKKEKIV